MRYFAGIDIGSTTIKVVIADEGLRIMGEKTVPSGSLFRKNADEAFLGLLAETGLERQEIAYVIATGYGRKLYQGADEVVSEITANAAGASALGGSNGSRVRTVINIGGQDLKIIRLDEEGNVQGFVMNDKCAAGTGRFLEMTARSLELAVDELGGCHHPGTDGIPLTINSTCTVFAESEIIGLLASGCDKERIVAGTHYSIARRVARLANRLGVEDKILFDGGPAHNRGLRAAIEDELMREVVVPASPQVTTALGAAVLARDIFRSEDLP